MRLFNLFIMIKKKKFIMFYVFPPRVFHFMLNESRRMAYLAAPGRDSSGFLVIAFAQKQALTFSHSLYFLPSLSVCFLLFLFPVIRLLFYVSSTSFVTFLFFSSSAMHMAWLFIPKQFSILKSQLLAL